MTIPLNFGTLVLTMPLIWLAPMAVSGPILDSVRANDTATLSSLLEGGADPDEKGVATPLYFAAQGAKTEAVELLLEHGADPNALSRWGTPLYVASRKGAVQVVRALLDARADPNKPGGEDSHTALHGAAHGGSAEIIALLLAHGADVNARGRWQDPPLHLAVTAGNEEAANLLRQAGAEPITVEPITRGDLEGADLGNGKAMAAGCTPCHTFVEGDPGERGPSLWNIVGRKKASEKDFPYSHAMLAEKGDWDYAALNQFLADVPGTVPGTSMYNGEVIDRQTRIDIIAWLRTLSDDPVPLP